MRIAFVSEHASPLAAVGGVDSGGQNVHVAELARALGAQGHQVTVFTRRDSTTVRDRVRMFPGVVVEHVAAGPPAVLPKDRLLPYMSAFGRYLDARWLRDPPDVVHAHFWMSGLAALAGARDHRLPVVQTFHALGVVKRRHQGPEDTSPESRIRTEVAIARDVAMVLATSSDEERELVRLGVPGSRIGIVPCGVDVSAFRPDGPVGRRSAVPRVLAAGRLVQRKGFETVVRAMPHVPDAELVIAGGPAAGRLRGDAEYRRLSRLAAELGLTERVSFRGRIGRADMPPLMRSADLLVSVPWYEPFGIVPLEAMACGVPVVVSAVGGHTDTVQDGVTGALVPAREPAELGRVLRDLLSRADLARYGSAAAERARDRYSWWRIAQETAAMYEQVRRPRAAVRAPGVRAAQHPRAAGGARHTSAAR